MHSSFASDNFSGVHPEVMRAIQEANFGHAKAYGDDPWTEKSNALFKRHFGDSAESYLVFNGTGANVSALQHLCHPWQAVLCPASSHIWNDEYGAPQAATGCTLIPVNGKNGKITAEQCAPFLYAKGSQHHVQPALISITQSTELGTVYSVEEIGSLVRFAHENNLLVHMDGARLCNAAATLKISLKALTADLGVDVLSFGGTKNGLMGVEAVVFLREGLAKNFQYVRKQQMQLSSKMRFLSAQMVALLEGDLWLRSAAHANRMAKLLEAELRRQCPSLPILYPVEANALFVQHPSMKVLEKLQKKSFFWIWDHEAAVARWVASWDTEPASVKAFVEEVQKIIE